MKVILSFQYGGQHVTVEKDTEDLQAYFKFVAQFSILPTHGPNGEEDLTLWYRKTPQEGYEYFSVVCKSAGQEFMFGQAKVGKELFPKGWRPIQHGNFDDGEEHQPQPVAQPRAAAATAQTALTAQTAATSAQAPLAKSPEESLLADLKRFLMNRFVYESTKESAGNLVTALLGAPGKEATLDQIRKGITATEKAAKIPALIEFASADWYSTKFGGSLASKMESIGLMIRYISEVGDLQELLNVMNGDPTKKNKDQVVKMIGCLKSWFEKETTADDIGF